MLACFSMLKGDNGIRITLLLFHLSLPKSDFPRLQRHSIMFPNLIKRRMVNSTNLPTHTTSMACKTWSFTTHESALIYLAMLQKRFKRLEKWPVTGEYSWAFWREGGIVLVLDRREGVSGHFSSISRFCSGCLASRYVFIPVA